MNEDFAVESLAGDVFQLGNAAYRIRRVERGTVRVEDAQGQPPNIPFWLGEAPGRSDELSQSVSRLRARSRRSTRRRTPSPAAERGQRDVSARETLERLRDGGAGVEAASLAHRRPASASAAAAGRLSRRRRMPRSGCLPTHDTLVFERFFDEAGGMQLVDPFALWQPAQPRLGTGAAQALLHQVQFRAAGGRDRGQHRPVADHGAQLRPRRGAALPASGDGARAADPGGARLADVHDALALGRRRGAGTAALPRRQEGAAAAWRAWMPRT